MSADIEAERYTKKREEANAADKAQKDNVELHKKMSEDPKFAAKIEKQSEPEKEEEEKETRSFSNRNSRR
jgi:hypothetical protein